MKKILLCGNSLWLDSLTPYLPVLAEVPIERISAQDLQNAALPKDVGLVLIDRSLESKAFEFSRQYPSAVLLSIDVATGKLTVMQSQTWTVANIQELAQVMRGIAATSGDPIIFSSLYALPR